jgi:hypothetical protein
MGAEAGPDVPAAEDALLQRALDRQRGALEAASHSSAARSWLRPSLASEAGTQQLLADLESRLAQDSWLAQLQREEAQPSAPPLPGGGRHEVINRDWWQVTEADTVGSQVSQADLDSYVVVDRHDVVDAIGSFVAAYLATLPEAQNMQPKQLQQALKQAFQELRQSRVRQAWRWGQSLYRAAAVTYSAFSLYTNPWLVRAVLAAVWTASRVLTGLL